METYLIIAAVFVTFGVLFALMAASTLLREGIASAREWWERRQALQEADRIERETAPERQRRAEEEAELREEAIANAEFAVMDSDEAPMVFDRNDLASEPPVPDDDTGEEEDDETDEFIGLMAPPPQGWETDEDEMPTQRFDDASSGQTPGTLPPPPPRALNYQTPTQLPGRVVAGVDQEPPAVIEDDGDDMPTDEVGRISPKVDKPPNDILREILQYARKTPSNLSNADAHAALEFADTLVAPWSGEADALVEAAKLYSQALDVLGDEFAATAWNGIAEAALQACERPDGSWDVSGIELCRNLVKKALKMRAHESDALLIRAEYTLRSGRLRECDDQLRSLAPTWRRNYVSGLLANARGRHKSAVPLLQFALEKAPPGREPMISVALARVYLDEGEDDQARMMLARILGEGDHPRARRLLAHLRSGDNSQRSAGPS